MSKIPRGLFMHSINIFSVDISTADRKTLLTYLSNRLATGKKTVIATPNTQMLLAAKKDPHISSLLSFSTLNIPDGIGVCIAAKIKSKANIHRISGIDLAQDIMELCDARGYRIFLLGGKKGVAKAAAKKIKAALPKIKICGYHHGYFEKQGRENDELIKKINTARPDVLFVCFGFPLQEEWIAQNSQSLDSVKLSIGLGGALDVWSGRCRRAPAFFQRAGLEWLWRVALEPRRAKIFLDIPMFLWESYKKE